MGFRKEAHAPNEIMLTEPATVVTVAGLADIEKAYTGLLCAMPK
jgi:hypothetical protein